MPLAPQTVGFVFCQSINGRGVDLHMSSRLASTCSSPRLATFKRTLDAGLEHATNPTVLKIGAVPQSPRRLQEGDDVLGEVFDRAVFGGGHRLAGVDEEGAGALQ